MRVKEIIAFLEELAPPSLQESYDNAGLLVGVGDEEVTKVIVCLDAIEEVVDEAIDKGAGMIIAHHPIVFSGIKKLNGKNYVERVLIKAIKNNIAIYAIHTNLDNVFAGVNEKIASKLGLENQQVLAPKSGLLSKLVTYVPIENKEAVVTALFNAGAGEIGNYSEASFSHVGTGTFKGNALSNPVIGKRLERASVEESRIEVLVETYKTTKVLSALRNAHPYEEVAYDLIPLLNVHQNIGAGRIGALSTEIDIVEFMHNLKDVFKVPAIKHTKFLKEKIQRIAICGGSGSFLLNDAIRQKADVFITADFKYHEFFDADNQIVIIDVGHYESEQYTSELLIEKLKKKFRNFAFLLTEKNTNPVKYFI